MLQSLLTLIFSDKRQNPEKTRTIAGVELSEAEFQTFKK